MPAVCLLGVGMAVAVAPTLMAMKDRPTAVFASNDLSAIGAMSHLQAAGLRVPEDISIVGFDDIPTASQVHPALTTVRQPIAEMGRAAVNTLSAVIAGLEVATHQVTLATELIIRESTAAPPDSASTARVTRKS